MYNTGLNDTVREIAATADIAVIQRHAVLRTLSADMIVNIVR